MISFKVEAVIKNEQSTITRQFVLEPGKSVNSKGWCNLCIADKKHHKPAGTTARERGLK